MNFHHVIKFEITGLKLIVYKLSGKRSHYIFKTFDVLRRFINDSVNIVDKAGQINMSIFDFHHYDRYQQMLCQLTLFNFLCWISVDLSAEFLYKVTNAMLLNSQEACVKNYMIKMFKEKRFDMVEQEMLIFPG